MPEVLSMEELPNIEATKKEPDRNTGLNDAR
jgi:hypothetical protein